MFADPHGKVFSMFLEMLPEFIANYSNHLFDWLYILMTQLLKKLGADLLGSVQAKVLNALKVTRESFDPSLQFTILSRYMNDSAQKPGLKVKLQLLHYLLELCKLMRSDDLMNNSETRMMIPRIITWTTEPKSGDVRRIAELVFIALFELNTVTIKDVIQNVSKTFREGAMKILHNHMESIRRYKEESVNLSGDFDTWLHNSSVNENKNNNDFINTSLNHTTKMRYSPNCDSSLLTPRDDNLTIMTSQNVDVTSQLREGIQQMTDDIHKLKMSPRSPGNNATTTATPDGGNFGESPRLLLNDTTCGIRKTPYNAGKYHGVSHGNMFSPPNFSMGGLNDSTLVASQQGGDDSEIWLGEKPMETTVRETDNTTNLVEDLAKLLSNQSSELEVSSNHDELVDKLRVMRRNTMNFERFGKSFNVHHRSVMYGLLEIIRTNTTNTPMLLDVLSILNMLLENLDYNEIISNYVEIVTNHLVNCNNQHRETLQEIDACFSVLSKKVPRSQLLRILTANLQSSSDQNEDHVLKRIDALLRSCKFGEVPNSIIDDMVPAILQSYYSEKSNTRKISCFCLVSIHKIVDPEILAPKLQNLPQGKRKLIELYIKKQNG